MLAISSKDFWILVHFSSLYNFDMVTSKHCKFGYASMCGNIFKKVRYFVPRAPLHNLFNQK